MSAVGAPASFLERSDDIYRALLDWCVDSSTAEERLQRVSLTSSFAANVAHPGRFSDGALEAMALELGERLEPVAPPIVGHTSPPSRLRRVLHVATKLFGVGGHTRLIANWIRSDVSSHHDVVILDQFGPVPPALTDLVSHRGGQVYVFPPATQLQRSGWLRHLEQTTADLVLLHTHPEDACPLVAFSRQGGPPVAVANHADHVFWLGSSVADLIISIRPWADAIARLRRAAQRSTILPIPLDTKTSLPTKLAARTRLGLAAAQSVLLSIGAAYKYRPTAKYDFYATAARVLDRVPDALLLLVGVSERDAAQHTPHRHPRIRCLGVVSDLGDVLAASDIYLEGFPYPSLTATLEAAASGLWPVLTFDPSPQLRFDEDAGLAGFVANSPDEGAYCDRAVTLLREAAATSANAVALATSVREQHGGHTWQARLDAIYASVDGLTHTTVPIPRTACETTGADLERSDFCASQNGLSPILATLSRATPEVHLREVFRLLLMSIQLRDTGASSFHARRWIGTLLGKL